PGTLDHRDIRRHGGERARSRAPRDKHLHEARASRERPRAPSGACGAHLPAGLTGLRGTEARPVGAHHPRAKEPKWAALGHMAESRITPSVIYRAVLLAFGLVIAALIFQALVSLILAVLIVIVLALPLSAFASLLERR